MGLKIVIKAMFLVTFVTAKIDNRSENQTIKMEKRATFYPNVNVNGKEQTKLKMVDPKSPIKRIMRDSMPYYNFIIKPMNYKPPISYKPSISWSHFSSSPEYVPGKWNLQPKCPH